MADRAVGAGHAYGPGSTPQVIIATRVAWVRTRRRCRGGSRRRSPGSRPVGAGGAHLVMLVARMVGGDQMLAAVLDPFHRPVEPHRRDADQHVLGIKLAADAEAAADVGLEALTPTTAAGRAFARSAPCSGAPPWRRRAAPARRARRRSGRSRRASPTARRNAGRGQIQLDDGVRLGEHLVDVAVALAQHVRLGVAARENSLGSARADISGGNSSISMPTRSAASSAV